MYWVTRKTLRRTLKNPFDPSACMSASKVNEVFTVIYSSYEKKYKNPWTKGSMPLNFFLDEFVKITGIDRKSVEESIVDYIKKNEVKDLTKEGRK